VVQRHVLYLSEINSSQELAWRKSIDVLEDGVEPWRCFPRTTSISRQRYGASVMVVTHRLALVSYCDHLYELEKGRLYPEVRRR
jgi:hypothetical protein